ncbi:cytochrome P450 [Haematococcus lacustris]
MEVERPSCWPLPRSVELDDLPRLKYLNACIKEAMRMLPVVSVMGRTSGDAPLQLGPYTLPPRTTVGIPLYAIQNADANWERAAEFLPERWMKVPVEAYVVAHMPPLGPPGSCLDSHTGAAKGGEAVTAVEARGALEGEEGAGGPGGGQRDEIRFMPFSEGPRNCVGQTLARIEVVAVLAGLLGAFRLELAPEMGGREGVRERESTLLTLQVRGSQGLRMALTPRWLP